MECAFLSGLCPNVDPERCVALKRTVKCISQKLLDMQVLEDIPISMYNTFILSVQKKYDLYDLTPSNHRNQAMYCHYIVYITRKRQVQVPNVYF